MVTTPERFTENIPISPGPSVTVKNTIARISLRLFTELFYVKNKTSILRVGADKSKRKAIRSGIMFWQSITNRRGHTKISEQIKKSLYNFILQNPEVVQSPISNDCLKLSNDSTYEPQLVPKLLLKTFICFQSYGKFDRVSQCEKSRALIKVIDLIIYIE